MRVAIRGGAAPGGQGRGGEDEDADGFQGEPGGGASGEAVRVCRKTDEKRDARERARRRVCAMPKETFAGEPAAGMPIDRPGCVRP